MALEWRPTITSAFVVYVTPRPSPVAPEAIDRDFSIVEVDTPDDPLLPKICANAVQLRIARAAIAEGRWVVIVALDPEGEPAGRIWETSGSERAICNGLPRMRLAPDEFLMFDLWVERKYRRTGIANTMAHAFFTRYPPETSPKRYGYGFISYENVPSILWHHSVGFLVAQRINYVAIGPFIKWKVPGSDVPRFGPMSRRGRHDDPTTAMFGTPLFPEG